MEHQQLREILRELHQHLQSGQPVDAETAALLRELSADVDRAAAQAGPQVTALTETQVERQTLLDRLLNVTEDFEETHPQLAEIIGRMATALSRIGI